MAEREDDFLARWSRRKADARAGLKKKEPERPARPARADDNKTETGPVLARAAEEDAPQADLRTEEENRLPAEREEKKEEREDVAAHTPADEDEEELPEEFKDVDFDKLDYDSDYTRFMKKGVPEFVRKRALRQLWLSNPILANVDGLNDYDEDFTDAALAVKGVLKSIYKPGKGYLTDEERIASYGDHAPHDEQMPQEAGGDAAEQAEPSGEKAAAPAKGKARTKAKGKTAAKKTAKRKAAKSKTAKTRAPAKSGKTPSAARRKPGNKNANA